MLSVHLVTYMYNLIKHSLRYENRNMFIENCKYTVREMELADMSLSRPSNHHSPIHTRTHYCICTFFYLRLVDQFITQS